MMWFFVSLAFMSAGPARGCQPDTLVSVVNDHDPAAPYVLVTATGHRLRAYGQDFVNPKMWKPRDPLDVCPDSEPATLRVRDRRRGEELLVMNDRAARQREPLQIMNGPGFRALLSRVARQCPTSQVRYATPAALLDADETVEATLDSATRRRLAAAKHLTPGGDYPRCVGRDGASCPANEAMNALRREALIERFTRFVCAHASGPWG
jgi:hypothetical protein